MKRCVLDKKFVIGIGSQRAGSTLLYKIIDECTEVYMNPIKELHYFDTMYKKRSPETLTKFSEKQLSRKIHEIVDAQDLSVFNKRFKNSLRANYLLATKNVEAIGYLDLFRPCVSEYEVFGEVTPEYMLLPDAGIKKMKEVTKNQLKVILIGRHPVRRFISAFKLLKVYGSNRVHFDLKEYEKEILLMLEEESEWVRIQDALNDYESTLRNYTLNDIDCLFLSMDGLIKNPDETSKKLGEFLEMDICLSSYENVIGEKVNVLGDTGEISNELYETLFKRYQKSLDFLDTSFVDGVEL